MQAQTAFGELGEMNSVSRKSCECSGQPAKGGQALGRLLEAAFGAKGGDHQSR